MVEPREEQRLLLARANQVDSGTGRRLPADVLDLCLEYGNIPLWGTSQMILVDVSIGFTEKRKANLRQWCQAEIDHSNNQVLFLTADLLYTPKQIRATLRRDRKQQETAASHAIIVILQTYPSDHTWKWLQERVHAKAMTVVYIGSFYSLFEPLLSSYDVLCTQEEAWLGGAGGDATFFVKTQRRDGVFFVRTRGKKKGSNLQRCIFQDHLLGLLDIEPIVKPPVGSQVAHSYEDLTNEHSWAATQISLRVAVSRPVVISGVASGSPKRTS